MQDTRRAGAEDHAEDGAQGYHPDGRCRAVAVGVRRPAGDA